MISWPKVVASMKSLLWSSSLKSAAERSSYQWVNSNESAFGLRPAGMSQLLGLCSTMVTPTSLRQLNHAQWKAMKELKTAECDRLLTRLWQTRSIEQTPYQG